MLSGTRVLCNTANVEVEILSQTFLGPPNLSDDLVTGIITVLG
jgi:hypothetical protein